VWGGVVVACAVAVRGRTGLHVEQNIDYLQPVAVGRDVFALLHAGDHADPLMWCGLRRFTVGVIWSQGGLAVPMADIFEYQPLM
jgi:hypothetical protein